MKVVKISYPGLVFLIIICLYSDAFAQKASEVNMQTVIVIETKQARFDAFLNSVSRQSGVVFSFSSTKIAADKILTLIPGKQTLGTFLNQLKAKTGLNYKIVGTHIIFLDKQTAAVTNQPAKVISNPATKPAAAKSLSGADQTPRLASSFTKVQPLAAEDRKQPAEVVTTRSASHEIIDSIQLRKKNDTLAAQEKQISDSMLINDSDSTRGSNIDSGYLVSADTTGIYRSAPNAGGGSPGNVFRDSEAKIERTESKVIWFIGAEISRITGFENQNETFQATGVGGVARMENLVGRKFALTAELSFRNFTGKYTYTHFSGSPGDTTAGSPKDTTIENFAIAPLLFGLKYYYTKKFYLSAEIGLALKASSATRTKLALSPSLGVLLPTGKYNNIDLSVRFTHIVTGYGTPESNGLENGGYGFVSIRAAYGIGGKRFRKGS